MQKSPVPEPSTTMFRPSDACRNQARVGSISRMRRATQSDIKELLILQKEINYLEKTIPPVI